MFDVVLYAILKKYVQNYVTEHAATLNKVIVEELPSPSSADLNTIYFVPNDPEDPSKGYNEYIFINGEFELIGTADVDFNNIGFYVDDKDDEMLIIDCEKHFRQVSTAADLAEYIKQYFDLTYAPGSGNASALAQCMTWINALSDDEKKNCYFVLTDGVANGTLDGHNGHFVYFVYTDGIPYLEEYITPPPTTLGPIYYVKSTKNGSSTWAVENGAIDFISISEDMDIQPVTWSAPTEADKMITWQLQDINGGNNSSITDISNTIIIQFPMMKLKEVEV